MPPAWTFPTPITVDGRHYTGLMLRSPTGEDVMMASVIPGASGVDVLLRLIATASVERVPYEAVRQLPFWIVAEMLVQICAPDHWTQLARDARAVARRVSDPGTKAAIETLAAGYDSMAISGAAVARDWMQREQKGTLH